MKINDEIKKNKLENAIFNMVLDHNSLNREEKKILEGFPNRDLEIQRLEKIAHSITHLEEKPMPILLKLQLMSKFTKFHFHFWQIFLVLSFLLSASGVLLFVNEWNALGQVFQIIVGFFISLILVPMTFFIYFEYEKQSIEIEKKIDYNLHHIVDYFKTALTNLKSRWQH